MRRRGWPGYAPGDEKRRASNRRAGGRRLFGARWREMAVGEAVRPLWAAAALAAAVVPGTVVAQETDTCEVIPPFTPGFEPELEWEWKGSSILPDSKQVMMTPVVVDINQDGIPDVIFNTFVGSNFNSNGVVRAVSGDDGHELWTVTNPSYEVRGAANVTAGDIDNDGLPEICTVPEDTLGFICFEHDGTFKMRVKGASNPWGGVSFHDLEGDGQVEILSGNEVYRADGTLLWKGADGMGGVYPIGYTGPISYAADIDLDGFLEVINDRAVYEHDGTTKWINTQVGYGVSGIGNFDADGYGEVVNVSTGKVSLIDHDGTLLWTATIPGGGAGGPPNIADFDNDGLPEIGVAGAASYVVYEHDGALKWSSPTQDRSSNRTGSSTFDFEGDGRAEVIYGDERYLRIYDGATGTIRFQVTNGSGTTYENPVIVDVDADGNAEIVHVHNSYHVNYNGATGVRVFRDKNDGWVNTRRIWNQHAYYVTNVNDDGTIPRQPAVNWLTPGLNTFRANPQGDPGSGTSAHAAPDTLVVSLTGHCVPGTTAIEMRAEVRNDGDAGVSAGLPVTFYLGNPEAGGTLLGTGHVPGVIPVNGTGIATLVLDPAPDGLEMIYAVADDDGTGQGRELECREENNVASAYVPGTCSPNGDPGADDISVTTPEDTSIGFPLPGYDPDGDPLTWTILTGPEHGTLTGGGPDVVYHPDPDYHGPDQFTYEVCDPTGACDTGTVFINVTPVNDRPEAEDLTLTTPEDTAVGVPLTGVDPDGDPLTWTILTEPEHGTLVWQDGELTYHPDPDYSGPDSFVYVANDGASESEPATVEIEVEPVNDPPVAACQDRRVAADDQCGACVSVDAGSYDLEGPEWQLEEAPMCSLEPLWLGENEVTLTITDPQGATDSCTAVVTVYDATPPRLEVSAGASDPLLLWPPNHDYHTLSLADCGAVVEDNCAGELDINAAGTIVSIYSDEPEEVNGNGDGSTLDDIVVLGSSSFMVRSERQGKGNGRVYGVTFDVRDGAGNVTRGQCFVGVPHDQSGPLPVDDGPSAGYTVP